MRGGSPLLMAPPFFPFSFTLKPVLVVWLDLDLVHLNSIASTIIKIEFFSRARARELGSNFSQFHYYTTFQILRSIL